MKYGIRFNVVWFNVFISGCISTNTEMTTQPVRLSTTFSTLQISHTERHNTGGFSTLSFSSDCTTLTTISDYGQAADSSLDKPVRRSGWYQAQVYFDDNNKLQSSK